ncbi:DUF4180 domain-containing protein [Nonomuraea dietziae]|uniref:DUF4180 domain-containing protein n=1 Tax=Nonomuraea dietziae TaxID=65515 RepID=UPI0033CE7194
MAMPKQNMMAVPAARLDEWFFSPGTRFAGELMRKFVNYGPKLVVVGDVSCLAASSALRALVGESNRCDPVRFVPDLAALVALVAPAFAARLGAQSS